MVKNLNCHLLKMRIHYKSDDKQALAYLAKINKKTMNITIRYIF